jgi:tRNA-(ms[2]io[6]A)-hydroxylase
LAREELRHFEQVHALLRARGFGYVHLSSSRYAGALRQRVRNREPDRLVDTLLTGALVEARSCERFLGLIEVLPPDLAAFYDKLLASEARHFERYLELAECYADSDFGAKLAELKTLEASLITEPDRDFRFHGGPLAASATADASAG